MYLSEHSEQIVICVDGITVLRPVSTQVWITDSEAGCEWRRWLCLLSICLSVRYTQM